MAVGAWLTTGMYISTPPTGVHRAAGTVCGGVCWAFQVDSAFIPGFKAFEVGGEELHTGSRHDWCLLYVGTCILAYGSAIFYLLKFYCVSGSTGRTSHEL